MVFDNQSKGMHIAVITLASVSALASLLAALFMGMYVNAVEHVDSTTNDTTDCGLCS